MEEALLLGPFVPRVCKAHLGRGICSLVAKGVATPQLAPRRKIPQFPCAQGVASLPAASGELAWLFRRVASASARRVVAAGRRSPRVSVLLSLLQGADPLPVLEVPPWTGQGRRRAGHWTDPASSLQQDPVGFVRRFPGRGKEAVAIHGKRGRSRAGSELSLLGGVRLLQFQVGSEPPSGQGLR